MSTANSEDYKGYRGVALNTLQKFKTPIWSDVEILTDEGSFKGLILVQEASERTMEINLDLSASVGHCAGPHSFQLGQLHPQSTIAYIFYQHFKVI